MTFHMQKFGGHVGHKSYMHVYVPKRSSVCDLLTFEPAPCCVIQTRIPKQSVVSWLLKSTCQAQACET